jgi:DNA repair protein RecO (recombination protein O)
MGGTYKVTGINLKTSPLGESDRLITLLTEEQGLLRAVAPGARKHRSTLGGRSGLFVVNQLLIAKGRTLDKIIQAETLESYPGLSQDLSKLTASQYIAELIIDQALSDQPQAELFLFLRQYLTLLEQLPQAAILACLTHALFQLLIYAGIAPQVQACCVSRRAVVPELDRLDWRVGFSVFSGGVVLPSEVEQLAAEQAAARSPAQVASSRAPYRAAYPVAKATQTCSWLTSQETYLLQQLADPDWFHQALTTQPGLVLDSSQIWLKLERLLRQYAEHHFDRPIRSAALIDASFAASPFPSISPS